MSTTNHSSRRRNAPTLSNLQLAPLSTTLVAPAEKQHNFNTGGTNVQTLGTSYIATYGGKSAPSTPGILSRSPSRHRHGVNSRNADASSKSYTHLAFADTVETGLRRTSKSTVGLLSASGSNVPKRPARELRGKVTRRKDEIDSEWLHRAGTAIATEARESKGQSWLASRASSTSLLARGTESDEDEHGKDGDDVRSPYDRPSPTASRLHSVRGSRRGSKAEFASGGLTGFTAALSRHGSRSSLALDEAGGYFSNRRSGQDTPAGPDFVDGFDDEDDEDNDTTGTRIAAEQADEEDVARLTKEKGFGVGGIVDKLVGWSMFPERGAESDDGGEGQVKEMQENRVERVTSSTLMHGKPSMPQISDSKTDPRLSEPPAGDKDAPGNDQDASTWSDAAWLLSVASKVLFEDV